MRDKKTGDFWERIEKRLSTMLLSPQSVALGSARAAGLIGLCLAWLAFPTHAQDGQVRREGSRLTFEIVIVDENPPDRPWFKMAGDVDRDGRIDILVAGAKGPLVLYRGPTWEKSVLAQGGWEGVRGSVADVDQDGWLDIVLGGTIWLKNPGRKKTGWSAYTVAKRRLHDVLVADLDGDGRPDIVGRDQSAFGTKTGNAVYLYRQKSPDRWEELQIPCPHGEGLALADLTGDGRVDIIIGNRWYENPGTWGAPWREHILTDQWVHPHVKVEVGDLNGDGRADVILAPAELAGDVYKIAWYEAPAEPRQSWREHVTIGSIEAVIHALAVADFDGDGANDVAYAEMHQGQDPDEVVVLLNRGGGSKWHKHVLSTRGSHDMLAADFDGDGRVDLLGANHGGPYQAVELFLNRTGLPEDR